MRRFALITQTLTFFRRSKTIISWHVLYIVDQCGIGEQLPVFVDLVDCIFER
jgi:hypothetical protein